MTTLEQSKRLLECGLDPNTANLVYFIHHNNTNVHIISTNFQLVKYNVFHCMSLLNLPKIKSRISKSQIGKIILRWSINVFFPLDIISNCTINKK